MDFILYEHGHFRSSALVVGGSTLPHLHIWTSSKYYLAEVIRVITMSCRESNYYYTSPSWTLKSHLPTVETLISSNSISTTIHKVEVGVVSHFDQQGLLAGNYLLDYIWGLLSWLGPTNLWDNKYLFLVTGAIIRYKFINSQATPLLINKVFFKLYMVIYVLIIFIHISTIPLRDCISTFSHRIAHLYALSLGLIRSTIYIWTHINKNGFSNSWSLPFLQDRNSHSSETRCLLFII